MAADYPLTRRRERPASPRGPFGDRRGERLDHVGVELGAGAGAQLAQRRVRGHPPPVRAIGSHRVERVAHEDDARAERDLRSGQAVRVAAAVVALVARAHEPGDRHQRRCDAEDPLADDGVAAHERPLLVVQRTGLGEDAVRDRHLADVQQLGGAHDLVERLGRQAEPAARLARQPGGHV